VPQVKDAVMKVIADHDFIFADQANPARLVQQRLQ
jgi:hypothetical protein